MRILIIANTFFELTETFIYNQIIVNNERDTVLVSHKISNQQLFPINKYKYHKVSIIPINLFDRLITFIRNLFGSKKSYSYPFLSTQKLLRLVKKENIDIIHAHFGPNGIRILPISKRCKIPLIVSFHGYDASELISKADYQRDLKDLYKISKQFITVSNTLLGNLQRILNDNSKISIVPYGVNLNKFSYSKRNNTRPIKILHVGRLVEKKGIMDLLTVFNDISNENCDVEFHVVGDGPDMQDFLNLISTFNLEEKVIVYGAVPQNEVLKCLRTSDIFVLNSKRAVNGDQEGLPNAILEAMATGCAVISTRHSGISDLITNGHDGVLIEENDKAALRAALLKLICDYELRIKLGANANRLIISKFSHETMSQDLKLLYHSILNTKK